MESVDTSLQKAVHKSAGVLFRPLQLLAATVERAAADLPETVVLLDQRDGGTVTLGRGVVIERCMGSLEIVELLEVSKLLDLAAQVRGRRTRRLLFERQKQPFVADVA